jgi:hypothetical protein
MKADELASAEVEGDAESNDPFEMANLFPATTGLPMTVWVSPRIRARHDARLKVNMTHGNHVDPTNTAVIGVRPSPHLIHGYLSPDDERAVSRWISLNSAALLSYWEGEIDTARLIRSLKKVSKLQGRPLPGKRAR